MTFDSCGNCRKAMAGPSLQLFQAMLSFLSPSDARIGKTCECIQSLRGRGSGDGGGRELYVP